MATLCIFFLDNSEIPSTPRCRQIVESHKYCLVRVIIFFFDMYFLYFVSHKFENFVLISYWKSFDVYHLYKNI